MRNKEKLTPFETADQARKRIKSAAQAKVPDIFYVSPKAAACMVGVREEVFKGHISISFRPEPKENKVYLVVGDQRVDAETALGRWQRSENPELSLAFREKQYFYLFGLFQNAHATQRAQELARGIHGAFLSATPALKDLRQILENEGAIPTDDYSLVQETMHRLWDSLPREFKKTTLYGLNPKNIFQS